MESDSYWNACADPDSWGLIRSFGWRAAGKATSLTWTCSGSMSGLLQGSDHADSGGEGPLQASGIAPSVHIFVH